MLALVVVLTLVVVVLGIQLKRTSDTVAARDAEIVALRAEIGTASRSLEEARDEVDAMTKARDDALERERRARRDAAEVAKRMQEEAEARVAAERARADALEERARLETELRAVADAVGEGSGEHVEELWALALDGVRRTWEVSVSPSPGMPNPLDDTDDPLRVAVEIEVDAAREEAGAAIELEWNGDVVAPVAVAVRTLSIVQALVAHLAKLAEDATLAVTPTEVSVHLAVTAIGEDGEPIVPTDVAPELQTEPGVFDIRLAE